MAQLISGYYEDKPKKKRAGVHSKCRTSNHKQSPLYKKKYKRQGR